MNSMPIEPLTATAFARLRVPGSLAAWLPRMHWLARTPYALLLHKQTQNTLLGCAGALRFGTDARIVLLRSATHDALLHAALAEAIIRQLRALGAERITVIAPIPDEPFWRMHGFATHEQVLRLHGGRFVQATHDAVLPMEPRHRLGVLHLDRKATGIAQSSALLQEFEFLAQVYLEGNVVRGFAMPLLGDGLIVADSIYAGLELQRWVLPHQAHLLLPASSPGVAHLSERGYAHEVVGARLVLGPDVARPELIYAEPFGAV